MCVNLKTPPLCNYQLNLTVNSRIYSNIFCNKKQLRCYGCNRPIFVHDIWMGLFYQHQIRSLSNNVKKRFKVLRKLDWASNGVLLFLDECNYTQLAVEILNCIIHFNSAKNAILRRPWKSFVPKWFSPSALLLLCLGAHDLVTNSWRDFLQAEMCFKSAFFRGLFVNCPQINEEDHYNGSTPQKNCFSSSYLCKYNYSLFFVSMVDVNQN